MDNTEPASFCIVMTTYADKNVGKTIIDSLLEKRLAACIQVVAVGSYYHWDGKINCDDESLLLVKTRDALYDKVEAEILRIHDYDVPEIIKVAIGDGFSGYLDWISSSCD